MKRLNGFFIKNDTASIIFSSLSFLVIFFVLDFALSFFLLQGINKFYGLGTNSDLALVGHSHLMLGADKEQMEDALNLKVSKYTREGVNVADREIMVHQLVRENPDLKTIIYGVDAWMLSGEGLSDNSFKLFYPFMDNPVVDNYIKSSTEFSDYFQHKMIRSSRFNSLLINAALRGYLSNWSNLKFGHVNVPDLQKSIEKGEYRKIESLKDNQKIFERTLDFLKRNDVQVILVYVPTIDLYNQAEPEKFSSELEYYKTIAKNYDLKFLDYTSSMSKRHDLFYDPIHLNPQGQEEFTTTLIKDIRKTLSVK